MTGRIRDELFGLRDEAYRDFQARLIPTVDPAAVIGVRTPALRALAKRMIGAGEASAFLDDLPHAFFEENQLHAFILSQTRPFEACIGQVERFLPFVDNWATCDQMSPRVFYRHRPALRPFAMSWLGSERAYTIRYGIGTLMRHYLDDDFDPVYPARVAGLRSDEYYVNMMIAWYFATALAKRYDQAAPFIEGRRLDKWTHNRAIQKALESDRIPPERKAYLKSLKI